MKAIEQIKEHIAEREQIHRRTAEQRVSEGKTGGRSLWQGRLYAALRSWIDLNVTVVPSHYEPALVPSRLIVSLNNYVDHGMPVGDFLTAVLANDLKEALTRADPDNRELLFQIAMWVHWEVPNNCCGSRSKVKKHIAAKAAGRRQS